MKKFICAFFVVLILSGCADKSTASQIESNLEFSSSQETKETSQEPSAESSSQEIAMSSKSESGKSTSESLIESEIDTYQSVLDDYTEKLKTATPILIDEYYTEAATNTEGLNGLANISNAKITKLAEISTEGIGKMAKLLLKTGSGKSSEYEEWAGKLQEIYMEEASKITDVYMSSAME